METSDPKKATILIVDDSPDSLAQLSAVLKAEYRVKVARDGLKALEIATGGESPDLILLDIMMPGIDGFETCRRLKADARSSAIPVIFLSAKTDEADAEKGLSLGADDYLTKPPNPAIAKARIQVHIQLKQALEALAGQGKVGIRNG